MEPNNLVKLMDSGLARFRLKAGPEAALDHVQAALEKEGGRVTRSGRTELILDNSDAWRWRFITAKVEESDVAGLAGDERAYAVRFKEANSNTRLRTLAMIILTVILLFAAGFLPWRWCRIAGAIAVIIACLLLLFSPDEGCYRRMQRIIKNLNE